jgi:hypothetical protein
MKKVGISIHENVNYVKNKRVAKRDIRVIGCLVLSCASCFRILER